MHDSFPMQMITVRYYLAIQFIAKYFLCSPFSWYTVEYPTSQLHFRDINTSLKASVYLSVTTRAAIGQFCPLKFKAVIVANIYHDSSPRFINFDSKRKFKTFFFF